MTIAGTVVRCAYVVLLASASSPRVRLRVAGPAPGTDIAKRHNIAVWAITRRRRQARLLRSRPNKVRPPLTRAALKRQLDTGVSRADTATAHHVALATVTRWCTHYGLNIVQPPRSTAARGVEIDARQLRALYV